jgi:hypothetical protein
LYIEIERKREIVHRDRDRKKKLYIEIERKREIQLKLPDLFLNVSLCKKCGCGTAESLPHDSRGPRNTV